MIKKLFLGLILLTGLSYNTPAKALTITPTPNQTTPLLIAQNKQIALTEKELSGFKQIDLNSELLTQINQRLNQIATKLNMGSVAVENPFAFYSTKQIVIGFTMPLKTESDQKSYDQSIKKFQSIDLQKDMIEKVFSQIRQQVKPADKLKIQASKPLSDINNLGNLSTGVSLQVLWEGSKDPLEGQMDFVTFRRNNTVVVTATVYLKGLNPDLSINQLATMVDQKVQKAQ